MITNDTLEISWIKDNYEHYQLFNPIIISQDTFLLTDKNVAFTDSLFRISNEEVERITEKWKGTLTVEPPRTN